MSDDGEESFWDPILDGEEPPVDIIYLALEKVELDEIQEWGEMSGMWSIRIVESIPDAIRTHTEDPANLMIMLGASPGDAREIASQCS
jgi:hypothetical protein